VIFLIVVISTLAFLFWGGPLWSAPQQATHLSRIVGSYAAVIPFAAVALISVGRFSIARLTTATALVWVAKMLVTATLWMFIAPGTASRYQPAPVRERAERRGSGGRHLSAATAESAGSLVRLEIGDEGFGEKSLRVRPGDRLKILNTGSELHTVHLFSGAQTFENVPLPASGGAHLIEIDEPGHYTIRCDIHTGSELKLVVGASDVIDAEVE